MTSDPAAPDAVAMLQRMHACVVLSENHGDVPRVSSDEVLAVLRATQAERARHAEEVASMRDEIEDWEAAAQELSNRLVVQTADSDSLRDQLRKVEGERDDARAQVAEVQHEHDALLQRADQAERELGAWQDWALTHCDPGDGSDDRHLRELVGSQLTSLRSLLPDVRACAEWVIESQLDQPHDAADPIVDVAKRLYERSNLAALNSQGGEGE